MLTHSSIEQLTFQQNGYKYLMSPDQFTSIIVSHDQHSQNCESMIALARHPQFAPHILTER